MQQNRLQKIVLSAVLLASLCFSVFCTGCAPGKPAGGVPSPLKEGEPHRETRTGHLFPEAPGIKITEDSGAVIDHSNVSEGYVMLKYEGDASRVKAQITAPDDVTYTYTLKIGSYEAFPLQAGNGDYKVTVLTQVESTKYAVILSDSIHVELTDEYRPFLYPNQYSWYTEGTDALKLGASLSDLSRDDLHYLTNVYHYIIDNIDYDTDLAAEIPVDYLPDIDTTLKTQKGICFDYASLMTALLRSQGIPTKLMVGYSGTVYHAWISVYLEETGWVDNVIQFNGTSWSLMDPTLAASNSATDVKKYIGSGENYTVCYWY